MRGRDLGPLASVFPHTARATPRGHLEVGGCDVADLAREFGTPLYIFCEETLRERARAFREAFRHLHPDSAVVYACKAFITPALARLFQEEGLGLDVVSGGELAVARSVGFPPERIYLHGNNKSPRELEEALDYGVGRVVVDNLEELEDLEALARRRGKAQPVLLRVTPGVDPHTHAYTTTGVVDSKFGLPLATGQAAEAVRRALASPSLRLLGVHFHLGSPIFEREPYTLAVRAVLEWAASLREEGFQMEELNAGGGFAIPYLRDQQAPSPEEYAEALVSTLREGCAQWGLPLPRLVVEPGRAIVGPAGVALYSVGSVKSIPGVRTYVAVDGGMGDNIRPALYRARYEALAATKVGDPEEVTATIVGKYCESGDILVKDARLPRLERGDLIALPAAGAYCLAMASTYNLNPRPAVVLVREGRARLLRRRETYDDLLRCDLMG